MYPFGYIWIEHPSRVPASQQQAIENMQQAAGQREGGMTFVMDMGSYHRHVRKVLCCRCLRDGRASRVTAMRDLRRIHAHIRLANPRSAAYISATTAMCAISRTQVTRTHTWSTTAPSHTFRATILASLNRID